MIHRFLNSAAWITVAILIMTLTIWFVFFAEAKLSG